MKQIDRRPGLGLRQSFGGYHSRVEKFENQWSVTENRLKRRIEKLWIKRLEMETTQPRTKKKLELQPKTQNE